MEKIEFNESSCVVWPDGPLWQEGSTGTIGKFNFKSENDGKALLIKACEMLKTNGCQNVLAPMDGDTWHNYRTIIETDNSPYYALEPQSGQFDIATLKSVGFELVEQYASSRAIIPNYSIPRPDVEGMKISQWDGKGAETLLEKLHSMAGASFSDKTFFKPLDKHGFLELYQPLLSKIDPRFILFAHNEKGELVGFLFGLPDFLQGSKPSQAIIKTYASMQRGVGHLLGWYFHEMAREMGFKTVVHALMHSENISLDRSKKHNGEIFRKYGLFAKKL